MDKCRMTRGAAIESCVTILLESNAFDTYRMHGMKSLRQIGFHRCHWLMPTIWRSQWWNWRKCTAIIRSRIYEVVYIYIYIWDDTGIADVDVWKWNLGTDACWRERLLVLEMCMLEASRNLDYLDFNFCPEMYPDYVHTCTYISAPISYLTWLRLWTTRCAHMHYRYHHFVPHIAAP